MVKGLRKAAAVMAAVSILMSMASCEVMAAQIDSVIDAGAGAEVGASGSVSAGGGEDFDFKEDGYFRVEYEASEETDVHIVIRDPEWSWDQLTDASAHGSVDGKDGTYYYEYDYDSLWDLMTSKGYGSFDDINEVCVETWGRWDGGSSQRVSCPANILSVEWINPGPVLKLWFADGIEKAVIGSPIAVESNYNEVSYQWYRASSDNTEGGTAIEGANSEEYTPTIEDIKAFLYCEAVSGEETKIAGAVPVFANGEEVEVTVFEGEDTASAESDWLAAESKPGGDFTTDMITPTGRFYVEYTGAEAAPELCLNSWTRDGAWTQAEATETGETDDGYYAVYTYKAFSKKWGTVFSDLSVLYLKDVNENGITVTSIKWIGGDIGKDVITGDAVSFDFNDGASGWRYAQDWANNTSEGTMTTDGGALAIDCKMNFSDWSQAVVICENAIEAVGNDLFSADIYIEKEAYDKSRDICVELSGFGASSKTFGLEWDNPVTIDGTEYYKNEINFPIGTISDTMTQFVMKLVAQRTDFEGKLIIDNIAFQKRSSETIMKVKGTHNVSDGKSAVFGNSGRSGRIYSGAGLSFTINAEGAEINGDITAETVITDTNGVTSTVTAEIGEFVDGKAAAHADIGNIDAENLKAMYIAVDGDYIGNLTITDIEAINGEARPITLSYGGSSNIVGGGGGGGGSPTIRLPYTWGFGSSAQDWKYAGWENDYTPKTKPSVGWAFSMLGIEADFSNNSNSSWSQFGVQLWNDNGMSFYGANHCSVDFVYDPAKADGSFKLKIYSDGGIDATADVDMDSAVDVTIGGKVLKKANVNFTFPPITKGFAQSMVVCVVGCNTSYKGTLYIDQVTLDTVADHYVTSTVSAKKNNSKVTVSSNMLKTALGESIPLPSTVKMADADANEDARALYAYLYAMGQSKSVMFGQQNNLDKKAGNRELSDADTKDVTGDYAAVFGIDSLSLSGSEYNAHDCNEKYGTHFPETIEGNIEGSAYFANKAMENGAIVTMSSHTPNFALTEVIDENAESYLRYNFNVYNPGVLTGNTANEILPGGKYNEIFNAYLDLIASFAGKVKGAILFRPFHENTGSWFWWGKALCDAETYKAIYRYTHDYLTEEKDVHNLIFLYGPGSEAETLEMYGERYPGDEYVDMVGFDMYNHDPDVNSTWMNEFEKELMLVDEFAQKHGKLVAITEVGPSNDTQPGMSQTALLPYGNKDMDWYLRVQDIASKSHASYLLTWANWASDSGFYTPYVVQKKSDGKLLGHEMLDNFINYYNDPRSVFASDHKGVLSNIKGITTEPVNTDPYGYIISPVSGSRITGAVSLGARVSEDAKVSVRFTGANKTLTYDLTKSDGKMYTSSVAEEDIKSLGESPDGKAELLINGSVAQEMPMIFNIELEEEDPAFIDDFEGFFGVADLLGRDWPTNSGTGCALELSFCEDPKYNGDYSIKAEYKLSKGGYTGIVKAKEADWSEYDAVELWIKPDGKNQHTVIQISGPGMTYEYYLEQNPEFAGRTDAMLVTIPFSEFVSRDEKGNPKGGLPAKSGTITGFGLWLNYIENENCKDGVVTGTMYYDAIRAVKSGSDKVIIADGTEIVSDEKGIFKDVKKEAWYYGDVKFASDKGLMSGTGDGMFEPENNMTRAQMAQILYNMENRPESGKSRFSDAAADEWYAPAVAWAAENGIVNGYSDTVFGAENNVTREEMAVILMRYAEYRGYDVSAKGDTGKFTDTNKISVWAADAMEWANGSGYINGNDNEELMPGGNALRCQIAAVLKRFCENN